LRRRKRSKGQAEDASDTAGIIDFMAIRPPETVVAREVTVQSLSALIEVASHRRKAIVRIVDDELLSGDCGGIAGPETSQASE